MICWRSAWAFGAAPELGALLASPEPAVVFARDGSRVFWANPAGARRLGAVRFADVAGREIGATLRRSLADLSRAVPEAGTLARLRLTDDLTALPSLCRCRPVRAGEERGLLVIALDGAGEKPTPEALVAFFTTPEAGAVLFDADGAVIAEGAPGLAAAMSEASPFLEFSEAGAARRLVLIERVVAGMPGPRAAAPQPALDGPALSMIAAARHMEASTATPVEREEPAVPPPLAAEPEPQARPHVEPRAESAPPPELAPQGAAAKPAARKDRPPERQAPPGKAKHRSVSAGRVTRGLSRSPVRFLWQTDAGDRLLFISPGLVQVVGRNAEIVGERWQEASSRMRLDPSGQIARALSERDTWSGLTAWWPIEGSNVRVPVELTALPVFGPDQSFQGYRGFGILRPAEALMPATFETRFGPPQPLGEPQPPYEESLTPNVVPIRADLERMAESAHLTTQERNAFEEIAAALRDRIVNGLESAADLDGEAEEQGTSLEASEGIQAPDEVHPTEGAERSQPPSPPDARVPRAPPATPRETAESGRERGDKAAVNARLSALGEQLAEARRRLREMTAILDTATDGVVVLDAGGAIESVNASAEALFGLDAHEMIGRRFDDLLTPQSRQSALDYLSGLRDNGVASLLNEGREVEAAAGAGSIPLFMTMGRISSEEGQRFCAVLREITHWKRIEADLTGAKRAAEEASSQKSEFLGRVSSEIRAPLNAIIGHAEAMIEERFGPVENERYREYLREIRTSGEHVVNLVDDLLDISRIEAGKLVLDFSAVPLNEIVQAAIALVQPQASRSRVVLRSSLSREVPAIVGDERTLRQIVLNLVSNAVRHAGSGGQVIVSTSLNETGEALLRIRDTGHGMTEAEVARALEPFRDLSIASLADRSATGLGLPLTKALVEANRASLSIKSARGEGTVMTVTIPPTRVLSE